MKLKGAKILMLIFAVLAVVAIFVTQGSDSNPAMPDPAPQQEQVDSDAHKESMDTAEEPIKIENPFDTEEFRTFYSEHYDFSDAVFVGDSRTEGLRYFGELDNAKFVSAKGLNVKSAVEKQLIEVEDGSMLNVPDALKTYKYSRVYVMLGINELGWPYEGVFVEKYGQLLDKIKEVNPNAKIYVQEILPVTREKSQSGGVFTNEKIDHYNELIKELALSKNMKFLEVSKAVEDVDGSLMADASTDGIHLKKSYCIKWTQYLKENLS